MNREPENREEIVDFLKKNYSFDPHEPSANMFNIEGAIYWFAYNHHEGQDSFFYSILSCSLFNPSRLHNNICDDDEITKDCYLLLVREYTDKKIISDFEIIDHGVDNPQYFPGCGVSGTDYTDVFTGCGVSAHEAFEECLEMAAINDWCVDTFKNEMSEELEADGCAECESCADCPNQCGESNQYYVSLRVKGEEK